VRRRDLAVERLADPRGFVRLAALVAEERIDVVHAHGQDASIVALGARLLRRLPLIVSRHVLQEPADTWRRRRRAELALMAARRADATVAVSAAVADWLSDAASMPRNAIRVVHNGIELERFRGEIPERVRAVLRNDAGCEPGARLILVPAALRPGKGHEHLLEALAQVAAHVPGVRCVFAGAGELARSLASRVERERLPVVLLGHREDVPELMAAADLVVLPSLSEALPTVLMEAAAAARPVVATRVGGAPEVVDEGRTGHLVPVGDAAALASAMTELLIDRSLSVTYGRAAREKAEREFDIERHVDPTLELWAEVVDRARR
jgi:glycosyltransferase involved in cell wall biosynthesis